VLADGNLDGGMWWAGQAQGLIHEVAPVRDVVDEIIAEAAALVDKTLPSLRDEQPLS